MTGLRALLGCVILVEFISINPDFYGFYSASWWAFFWTAYLPIQGGRWISIGLQARSSARLRAVVHS
jgi:hypothetical protein